jgi:ribosome-associated protein YbcJ (S4-like RNA binding protein)
MKTEAISDLKLFNEKAVLLLNSSFADAMLRNESAFMFSWEAGKSCEAVVVGAEGESVDAAFLTLRMFLQNNDCISIGNMAKIYSQEQELDVHRSDFNSVRDQINEYLDHGTAVDFFGKIYTNREVIELLLYGSKGHTNRAKEAELRSLLENPIISKLFLNLVNVASANLIKGIAAVAKINDNALFAINTSGRV